MKIFSFPFVSNNNWRSQLFSLLSISIIENVPHNRRETGNGHNLLWMIITGWIIVNFFSSKTVFTVFAPIWFDQFDKLRADWKFITGGRGEDRRFTIFHFSLLLFSSIDVFFFFFFLSLLYMKFPKDQKRVKRRKEGKKTTVASSGSIAKKETPFELPLWFVISRVNEARNIGSMAKFVGQVVHPGLVSRRIILFPAHVPILLMPLRTYRVIETISNVVRRSSVNLIVNVGWIVPLARNKLLLPLRRIPRRVIDHVSHGQALPPSQASRVFKTPFSGRAVY